VLAVYRGVLQSVRTETVVDQYQTYRYAWYRRIPVGELHLWQARDAHVQVVRCEALSVQVPIEKLSGL
jgi:hypothetical protein